MKTEQEVREMKDKLTEILNNQKLRASQMVSLDEIITLGWVLGEQENWNDNVFRMYKAKKKT
jgi:hypothetical protein